MNLIMINRKIVSNNIIKTLKMYNLMCMQVLANVVISGVLLLLGWLLQFTAVVQLHMVP